MEREKKRLFIDMDGTLAEFKSVDTLETLYEEGYFLNLKPQMNVVNAVRRIKLLNPDIEVYILSSVLSDSKYALNEKNAWLDRYLPEIDKEHRLFPACGTDKREIVAGGVTPADFLLDDYSMNLRSWDPPARGIKLRNGINGNNGTWTAESVSYADSPEKLSNNIVKIMNSAKVFQEHFESDLMMQPLHHRKGGR